MFDLMILAPIGAVAALAYAFILSRRVMAQSEGTDLMKKIAASIRSGANALPEETYKGVSVFFVIMGVVLVALVFARSGQRIRACGLCSRRLLLRSFRIPGHAHCHQCQCQNCQCCSA